MIKFSRCQLCSFLSRPGQSQLMTSTMLWRASGLCSLQEYLHYSLGMAQTLYPTVLGVKLAEDLNLGKRFVLVIVKQHSLVGKCKYVFFPCIQESFYRQHSESDYYLNTCDSAVDVQFIHNVGIISLTLGF